MGRCGNVAKLFLQYKSWGTKCVWWESGLGLEIALACGRDQVRVRQEGVGVDGLPLESCRCKANKAGGDGQLLMVLLLMPTKDLITGIVLKGL